MRHAVDVAGLVAGNFRRRGGQAVDQAEIHTLAERAHVRKPGDARVAAVGGRKQIAAAALHLGVRAEVLQHAGGEGALVGLAHDDLANHVGDPRLLINVGIHA